MDKTAHRSNLSLPEKRKILLGIDFDNTVVSYDGIFHKIALERGLIPENLAPLKESVRDHLRQSGQEEAWTEMQGFVYGPGLEQAKPFPGALETLRTLKKRGAPLRLISHKTRHPYRGPAYNLHDAAHKWLSDNGFVDAANGVLRPPEVRFLPTREEKLSCIETTGCTHYIDDLPEILLHPKFPKNVQGILFDPACNRTDDDLPFPRISSWAELPDLIPTTHPGG